MHEGGESGGGGALLNTIFITFSSLTMALTRTLKYLIQTHCDTEDIIQSPSFK